VAAAKLRVVSPANGEVVVERALTTGPQIDAVLGRARAAQADWRGRAIAERARFVGAFVDAFVAKRDAIAQEITLQMGRPIAHSPGEVGGLEERSRHMIAIAEESLAAIEPAPREGFRRFIRRDPLGVVLTIAPWNYPFLTAVNSIVPALLAGNAVVLRHSSQTPLCAERFAEAFEVAELPEGVFQIVHASHLDTQRMIAAPEVDFVAFTGSVDAGHSVTRAAAERFIGIGLELGGKDPAYVRADADVAFAAEQLADGAFFNAGQSCCGIERIYVDAAVYEPFVEGVVDAVRAYALGDPRESTTTLGPLVKPAAADFVRGQTAQALASGARALIEPTSFPRDEAGSAYLAPQVLVDVDHSMRIMTQESFGPVVGIQRVSGDDEAVPLMNDSAFGLTASVWTRDEAAAIALGTRVETGTWFMNRCDYLDPALAWTGVKDSGRGCTLSRVGFEALTRPKSFHLRHA